MRFLVTGGAGYVGSHLVAEILVRGGEVVVVDNLVTGHRLAVSPGARLIEADIGDPEAMAEIFAQGPFEAVFHFAARSLVGESMRDPLLYFRENVGKGAHLITACAAAGVRKFVFSSTAALFGVPQRGPIAEDAPIAPVSAYGESKAMIERMLDWAERAHGMRVACLRYFNAAGADPAGRLGEDHRPETHLIPLAIDAALGRRDPLQLFGTDFPTPDGTCIRDYIHVSDLADAHLRVLSCLDRESISCNLGTGRGNSVREVLRAIEVVSGKPVPHSVAGRRAGDPAVLVAASGRIAAATGWAPHFTRLEDTVATAWKWREAHPMGFGD
jgi:UDP-glucose 4-epimerase